jgi:hypothetical protein|nr:MAG TPA: Integrin alpha-IIb, Integrin beta-3, transmembrane signaling, protein structure [Caudoviricetes sp.]
MLLDSFIVGIALLIFAIVVLWLCNCESAISDIICFVILVICVFVIEYVCSQ